MKNKIVTFIKDPLKIVVFLAHRGVLDSLSDEKYLKLLFYAKQKYKLNINNPRTYNEKLQWIKLFDHNPIYTQMVDKHESKAYVASIIGDEYIIPTIAGPWKSAGEIDESALPKQFVLKTTHDSGGVVICKDKDTFDFAEARRILDAHLKSDFYKAGREWPYKNVIPRIICEKYMQSDEESGPIKDYKFYCFDGFPKMVMINTDRGIDTKADYFDMDFQWLDFTWGYEHADTKPKRPVQFEQMKQLAKMLSKGLKEVRVDFYEVNGCVYFGELTFFDGSGFDRILPHKWDLEIGSWLKL